MSKATLNKFVELAAHEKRVGDLVSAIADHLIAHPADCIESAIMGVVKGVPGNSDSKVFGNAYQRASMLMRIARQADEVTT
jgi:hypothetical protein